jgi:ubiquinone/menaquinone biosynthesis C-methylase UbiE
MAADRTARWHRYWDKQSGGYDKTMAGVDRRFLGDSRRWACEQAEGDVLEVAVGTGLNLPHYPDGVRLTGVDLSDGMLDGARRRAAELGHPVTLRQADAHALPFADASFDTVVCTLGLCAIPDHEKAIEEMVRVLRPGGALILVDHVESTNPFARVLQRVMDLGAVPLAGEHFRRRPARVVAGRGLDIVRSDRFKLGVIERLVARKPV